MNSQECVEFMKKMLGRDEEGLFPFKYVRLNDGSLHFCGTTGAHTELVEEGKEAISAGLVGITYIPDGCISIHAKILVPGSSTLHIIDSMPDDGFVIKEILTGDIESLKEEACNV